MMNKLDKKFLVVVCAFCAAFIAAHAVAAPSGVEANVTSTPPAATTQKVAQQNVVDPSLYLIDTIQAVIYTEEGTDLITKSDVERISLDGSERQLEELIIAHLMYRDAVKFKMVPDEDMVDQHLKAMQRTHNLTLDQIKEMFAAAGYTYEEGRQELAMLNTINNVLDYKVRSRLLVPEKDILAYYEANPMTEPASYRLEKVMIPFSNTMTRQEQKEALISKSQTCDFEFGEPFWVMQGDLAVDKMFITTMQQGEISEPYEVPGGFELFKLCEARPEHLVSLADRSMEISNTLRRPRYQQLMQEYNEQLKSSAAIIIF